jgi:hypothetical protein
MAFNFNGNTPKVITYNGNDVKKLIYNGVTVWTKSNPVYWLQGASHGEGGTVSAGYPTEWTITFTDVRCDHPEDCEIYIRNVMAEIYCNSAEEWWVEAQATGSTNGNQYMEIVVSQMTEGSASIACNGTTISKAGTYTINVDGLSTVTMYASLHWWSDPGYFSIDSIRFY